MSVRTVRSVRRVRNGAAAGTVAALFGLVTACSSGGSPHAAAGAPAASSASPGSTQIGHLSLGQDPAKTSAAGSTASSSPSGPDSSKSVSGGETTGSHGGSASHPTVKDPGRVVKVTVPAGWRAKGVDVGSVPGGTSLSVTFALASRDPQGLKAEVAAVSNPASPQYHHFLSDSDYAARYAPDPAVRDALADYLTSAGLKVSQKNQDYVSVDGSATTVEQALKVSVHNYKVGSDTRFAPTGSITLPASLSSAVLLVSGLDNTPTTARPAGLANSGSTAPLGLPHCTAGYGTDSGQTSVPGAYVDYSACPYDFQAMRKGYGVPATGLDGRGVTVGVVDLYNPSSLFNDASVYARTHGWAGFAPLQFTDVTDSPHGYYARCGGTSGWYEEAAMDVQAVHAIAPAANVVYGAAACDQYGNAYLYAMMDYLISNHVVDIMTNSWTMAFENELTKPVTDSYDLLFQQAAVKGIGIYFASGDCGDSNNTCNPGTPITAPAVWYPSSSPYVTAVGGTAMALDGSGNRLYDAPWADVSSSKGFLDGSGGGTSITYAAPTLAGQGYQQPGGSSMRRIPDVSLDASPYTGGMAFGIHEVGGNANPAGTYTETSAGGTSLATPLLAGLQALVQQRAGHAIGFANPRLYAMAAAGVGIDDVVLNPQPGPSGTTPMTFGWPSTSGFPVVQEIPAGAIACGANGNDPGCVGYDTVTGIGSPSTSYITKY